MGALENELLSFSPRAADTLYFGGGTPSLADVRQISRLISLCRERFSIDDKSEITLEANPASCGIDKLRELRAAGVNRLSVGVQSLDDGVLHAAGRLHSAHEAVEFISDAQRAGFDNLSADVMLSLPGSTPATLEKTLRELTALGIAHISAYILKIMPGTPFAVHTPPGLSDDDAQADEYEQCCAFLKNAGFSHYEISNFAREPRFESRHNKKYWDGSEWLGLGAAAHGCVGARRYSFPRDLGAFVRAFDAPLSEREALEKMNFEGERDAAEYIMLRLRTSEGLDLCELYDLYNIDLLQLHGDFVDELCRGGLASVSGGSLRLTEKGFLVSNSIIASLI